ncbi:hypothetical protein [Thermomonas sp.]|uniref:hypothetical protein n=1 Tax=Thermomonas sp. TaxID=1971895 RepID=UPI0035B43E13
MIEDPSIMRMGAVTSSASDGIGMMVPLAKESRFGAMAGDAVGCWSVAGADAAAGAGSTAAASGGEDVREQAAAAHSEAMRTMGSRRMGIRASR